MLKSLQKSKWNKRKIKRLSLPDIKRIWVRLTKCKRRRYSCFIPTPLLILIKRIHTTKDLQMKRKLKEKMAMAQVLKLIMLRSFIDLKISRCMSGCKGPPVARQKKRKRRPPTRKVTTTTTFGTTSISLIEEYIWSEHHRLQNCIPRSTQVSQKLTTLKSVMPLISACTSRVVLAPRA